MATFSYIARTAAGERVTGEVAGASAQSVLAELQSRQLAPVQVREVRARVRFRSGISARKLATAYRQMADLLRAGVPLLRALRLLGRSKANPRLAPVMNEIADAVSEGGGLADAMAQHIDVFPPVQVAMIRAGERGGFLDQVLERLGRFLEHQADVRGKVVSNMIYPALLLLVAAAVLVGALVFLVPRFEEMYARIELPVATRLLLGTSSLLVESWLVLIAVLAVLAAAVWWLWQHAPVRRAVALRQLQVPVLGRLVRDLAVGRFARILGTLLENGIPMLPAMQISREATGHVILAEAIERATESVRAGETLAAPLAASGMFAEDAIEMIQVGESANNLPDVLITMADTVEKRVDRTLTVLVRMLEPLVILFMAGIVMFIFMALVLPMIRMGSAV